MLRLYQPRCTIKHSVLKKNDWRGCCRCLQNAQCAVARLESSAHPATAQSSTDSDRRGLVLLQTVFHGPLDLLPAKWKSVSIALLSFYLTSWIISLAVPSLFSSSSPLQHPLSALSPHLKVSLQSVFERQVQWASERNRDLPDEVSWGTRATFCPGEQMHLALETFRLQLVPAINAICVQ